MSRGARTGRRSRTRRRWAQLGDHAHAGALARLGGGGAGLGGGALGVLLRREEPEVAAGEHHRDARDADDRADGAELARRLDVGVDVAVGTDPAVGALGADRVAVVVRLADVALVPAGARRSRARGWSRPRRRRSRPRPCRSSAAKLGRWSGGTASSRRSLCASVTVRSNASRPRRGDDHGPLARIERRILEPRQRHDLIVDDHLGLRRWRLFERIERCGTSGVSAASLPSAAFRYSGSSARGRARASRGSGGRPRRCGPAARRTSRR